MSRKRVYTYSSLDARFIDSPLNPVVFGLIAAVVAAAIAGCF